MKLRFQKILFRLIPTVSSCLKSTTSWSESEWSLFFQFFFLILPLYLIAYLKSLINYKFKKIQIKNT